MSDHRFSRISLSLLILLVILFSSRLSIAQTIGDGFPERAGTTTPKNVTYTATNGQVTTEVFQAPDIVRDFSDVTYLFSSPVAADRAIERLPTFGLAIWHWWLFGTEILPHAQRDYMRCVGEIRNSQMLLGVPQNQLIDQPGSPLYGVVHQIADYLVPFGVVERFDYLGGPTVPPGIEEAKAHARAAIDTINLTVFHHGLCEVTAAWMREQVKARMK